jgi:putative SOS response-associated peptidase YedK
MCGRYVLHVHLSEITDEFEIYDVDYVWEPSFNIAPGQNIAGVVKNEKNRLATFRWGFIPRWTKKIDTGIRMINARAETLSQKPAFSYAFQKQRCIIPANGFYEWQKEEDKKRKIPFYLSLRSDKLMGFAGLYDKWKSPEGKIITSCTIITTSPNELVQPLHNRMPVILEPDKREMWLDKTIGDPRELMPLLKPYDAGKMKAVEVAPKVNSTRYNRPDCIKPVKSFKEQKLF